MISRFSLLLVVALAALPVRAADAQLRTPSRLEPARIASSLHTTPVATASLALRTASQACDASLATSVLTGALVGAVVVLGVILADVRDVALDAGARPRNRTPLWVVGVGGGAVVGAILWRRSCPYGRVSA